MKYKVSDTEKFFNMKNPNMVTEDKGILTFNTGIWGTSIDNAMPQFMIDLQSNSSTHSNMINLKTSLITGENIEIEDPTLPNADRLNSFIKKRNKSGDNLKGIWVKASSDMAVFEAVALQVLFARNGSIAEIYHVPTEDVRLGKPNQYGQIEYGYISKNWANISNKNYKKSTVKNSAVQVRMFEPELFREYPVQLLYIKKYAQGMHYAIPKYLSATNWMLIDNEISNFHLSNIRNSFFLSGMLTQQGNPDDKEMQKFIDKFNELYMGVGAPNKKFNSMMFSWVDDINQKAEFTPFQGEKNDELFNNLIEKAGIKIIEGHNGYSGLIMDSKGADLGGDANKLYTQIATFMQYVTEPMKDLLLGGFDRILQVNDLPSIAVVTNPPKITQPVAEVQDLTQDERREIVYGLPPIEKSDEKINDDTPEN
jgi:hypothetical protein